MSGGGKRQRDKNHAFPREQCVHLSPHFRQLTVCTKSIETKLGLYSEQYLVHFMLLINKNKPPGGATVSKSLVFSFQQ